MDFLAGEGEMAQRIRAFDWASHPFGPPADWPQSLRAALSICLNSAFPTAIYWGPELRLLYNDAWAPIPGPRHPAALGQPAREVWSDIWHIIDPQFAQVIEQGQGLFAQEQMLPMRRHGIEEETWWNYSFTPLRDADGGITGVFNSGSEITENVIQRRNAEFLVAANNAFRTAPSPDQALRFSLAKLGELLGACRVGLRERTQIEGQVAFAMIHEWCAEGTPPSAEIAMPSQVGVSLQEKILSGEVTAAALSDADLEPASREYLERVGVVQGLGVPWVENGEVTSVIGVQWHKERVISAFDISAIERVLETTMGWIERERGRERERVMASEIDHRARNLLAVVQSVTRMTTGDDVAQVKADLEGRFAALSRVHGLLGQKRWVNVTFQELAEEELAPFGPDVFDRIEMSGPQVALSPTEAQVLAMVLHELTTNALKHGFLSTSDGRLALSWALPDTSRLDVCWHETGVPTNGPAVSDGQEGYGSVLLHEVVKGQLGGEMRREVGPGGIRFDLSYPRQADTPGPSPSEVLRPSPEAPAPARSVMIVEDDVIIAMDLAATLEEGGFARFGEFRDSQSALARLESERPDLAILDWTLAEGTSEPVAAWLRENGIPFVVVSGQELSGAEDDPRRGAPLLIKPISYTALLSTLDRL
ncbi:MULTISPECIES: HWE histidine kinase domain-containing protein [Marinovum]|uniref:HWE histidine kinase domain-containing protein n=1 Tax=Marinovum TaxID=367771 RepID=UPI00065C1015|nr:HWE histidine kinase domain-containing protein [Marinovum sp. PR37]MDD9743334.1 HWE histidine kinase domain-containing protein [Marinovum sp. PR37]